MLTILGHPLLTSFTGGGEMSSSQGKAQTAQWEFATPVAAWARSLVIGGLALAYFAATQLSFALTSPEVGLAAFWPAAGILAGGMMIVARRDRAWLIAAIFAVVLATNLAWGAPLSRAFAFAFTDALAGAIFAAVYEWRKWEGRLRTPADMGHFLAATLTTSLASAAVGIALLRLLAHGEHGLLSFLFWGLADFVGIFAVAPVLFFVRVPPMLRRISREAALAMIGAIGISAAVFLTPLYTNWMQLAPLGMAAPFVLWCAMRGSTFANALLMLAITIIAMVALTYGLGPYSGEWALTDRILATQTFILRAGAASVLLSVLFEERRRRESQLRTIFDTVPVGLILTEATSGRVIGGNAYVERLMGHDVLSKPDLRTLGRARAFDDDDQPVDPERFPWVRMAQCDREEPAMDVNYRRGDGSYAWLRLLGRQVRDESGATVGNVFALVDIDEEKKAWSRIQSEVDNLQIRLLRTSQASAMGTLASSLAHELNQPLTAIVNYLQAARRLADREEMGKAGDLGGAIQSAEECAVRAGEIIRRLRRMLAGESSETACVRVIELVEESIALACAAADDAAAEFALDVAPDLCIEVDAIQIQQVLINLITNALDATQGCDGRKIAIRARAHAQMVEIEVVDSGPGFADSIRQKLFEPFVSTKRHHLGVGLSICRTIVERQGGRIQAGEGAEGRVAITLPIAERRRLRAA